MNTLTKTDFALTLARELGLKKAQAKEITDVFFDVLREAILQSDRIEIRGFGVWEIRPVGARPNARNPKTGERVFVPPRRKVLFKPGKILKEALSSPLHSGLAPDMSMAGSGSGEPYTT